MPRKADVERLQPAWWDPADDLVFPVVYGSAAGPRRGHGAMTFKERRLDAFLRTRTRWRKFLAAAREVGSLTTAQHRARYHCWPAGVKLSQAKVPRQCHDPICPFCYFRSLRKPAADMKWDLLTRTDLVAWQRQLTEDEVIRPADAFYAQHLLRQLRDNLLSQCVTMQTDGLCSVRLWVEFDENQEPVYFAQLVVLGSSMVTPQSNPDTNGTLTWVENTPVSEALRSLRFCRAVFELPDDVLEAVTSWNKSIKRISIKAGVVSG